MNESLTYVYATGDLIEQRQTYFYSEFYGESFLSAWRSQRAAALPERAESDPPPVPREARTPTERLLDAIRLDFTEGNVTADTHRVLASLIQRFEVTKRMHGEYNSTFRPVDPADYRDLEAYVRFAEVLDVAHAATQSLPSLNALLKCLDTLTAQPQRLDSSQQQRLRHLIRREGDHVEQLGIAIAGAASAS